MILLLLLLIPATLHAGTATRPAGTSQPASQPAELADSLSKYYSLMRNEFMKTEDDDIVLTTPEIEAVISQIRSDAGQEKIQVDAEIEALTAAIAQADKQRRTAEAAEKEAKKDARRAASKEHRYSWHVSSDGRFSSRTYHDGLAEASKNSARRRADARAAEAAAHKGDIRQMRVDLVKLKRESAALAAISSPHNRSVPPKLYWEDYPKETQKQLDRIGITRDEFSQVIRDMKMTDAQFVSVTEKLADKVDGTDELIGALREVFARRMPAPKPKPGPKKTVR